MFNNFFNEKIKEFYPTNWQFGFQEPVTPVMEGIVRFHHDLFFFLTIILVFVMYMLARCIVRFDKTKNPEPIIVTHAPTLEIVWTLIPAAILFVIAIPSFSLLYSMDYLPSPFLTFKVVGHQWYWSYEFVNPDFIEENEEENFYSHLFSKHQDLEKALDELQGDIENLSDNNKVEVTQTSMEEQTQQSVEVDNAIQQFYEKSKVTLPRQSFNELVNVVKNLDSPSSSDFAFNYFWNHIISKGEEFTKEELYEFLTIWNQYEKERDPQDVLNLMCHLAFDDPDNFLTKAQQEKHNEFLQSLRDSDIKMILEFIREYSPNNDLLTKSGFDDFRKSIRESFKEDPDHSIEYTNGDLLESNNYENVIHFNHTITNIVNDKENFNSTFTDALKTLADRISRNNNLPQSDDYGFLNYDKNAQAIKTLYNHGFENEAYNFLEKLRNINFVYNEAICPTKSINPFNGDNWKLILDHVENWKKQEPNDIVPAWKDVSQPKPSLNKAHDLLVDSVFNACLVETNKVKTDFSPGTVSDNLAYLFNSDKMSFNVNYGFRNCLDPKVFESNKDFERNFYTFADLNRIYNEKLIDEMLTVVENDTTSQNNKEENTNISETENEQVAVQYDVFKAFLDKLASPKPPQEEDLIITYDSYMLAEDDISNDAERLLKVDNPLYLPTRQHVRLLVTSSDVLHSWAVPSLGIKIDACPGRLNQTTTYIYRSGVYFGQCSELCGVNHGFMPINVHAVDLGVESDADAISLNAAKYIFKMLIVQMFA